jgi:cytidine deaminase
MTDLARDELVHAALDAQQRAYCPYSHFPVGAAVRTASGQIFQGVNVENVSYGLTICAERVAVAAAVTAGELEFTDIAVVSNGGASPCGACRQFLAEFNPNLRIIMVDSLHQDHGYQSSLAVLLPSRFDKAKLDSGRRG